MARIQDFGYIFITVPVCYQRLAQFSEVVCVLKSPVLMLIYKDIPEPPTLRPLFFINE